MVCGELETLRNQKEMVYQYRLRPIRRNCDSLVDGYLSEKPKTYRSVGLARIDDNFRISLNIRWLLQIILGVTFVVLGYIRIENRIAELERRVELSDTEIEELVSKHIAEEEVKIAQMQQELDWYEKELNLNPLSWGKKKKKRK